MKKVTEFQLAKEQGNKITMITCYDFSQAKIANSTDIDCLLVGDSAAMVMLGHETTVPATMDCMAFFTEACARGAPDKFIIADLPFLSYRISQRESMRNVQHLMQRGAHAIKLEGANGNLDLVKYIVDSGVPVMGHLGLTPQSYFQLGGFRVQGKDDASQEKIKQDALALQAAGCFALVLECIPSPLASAITAELSIPTIGIGAGAGVDGQVLVWHDLLGMDAEFCPQFAKQYLKGAEMIREALQAYHSEVKSGVFPQQIITKKKEGNRLCA